MSVAIFKDTHLDCPTSTLKMTLSRGSTVYTNHKAIYQDLSVVKFLNKANFSVHLVRSNLNKRNYVMKVFPQEDGQPHFYYTNESRFGCLQHPNIVRSFHFEKSRSVEFDNISTKISYMIMEHVQNGDLLEFLKANHTKMDEKLARTFFQQLIQGLEYIHRNEIAHLDIKLDNLLLDSNFNLKICDFDKAHFAGDVIIISQGSKYYRAPELRTGTCNEPKLADIYSAAVVLFVLKTQGMLPYLEDDDTDEGADFGELLKTNVSKFWDAHRVEQNRDRDFFGRDFCELFIGMTKEDPQRRYTIQKIKQSAWYNGPVYDNEELIQKFKR